MANETFEERIDLITEPTSIRSNVVASTGAGSLAYKESADWDNYYFIQKKVLKNLRYKQDTRHRWGLGWWAAGIVTAWLICVMTISFINVYTLSDSVLITLLTTTTLNILGLIFIVLNDLFKGGNNKRGN